MILKDLKKAFYRPQEDTLDHKTLLRKMTYLSFKTPVIKWSESFQSNRKLFVFVHGVFSEAEI